MSRISLSIKLSNLLTFILFLSYAKVYALESPFKEAQLSIGNKNLSENTYEYSLKFKLFGYEEFQKWKNVKEIDLRFKTIDSRFLNSEVDIANVRNYVQALDIKQKQKQYAEYNKWMSKFRDSLTSTYENSNTDVNTVFKIIAQDEEKQLMGLELNEQKNDLMPQLAQIKVTWDQIPENATLNVKNIHRLLESLSTTTLNSHSQKAYDLYSKMAQAEYEFKKVEDTAFFDGFELVYEKDFDQEEQAGDFGVKAVFNLNFLRQEKQLFYSDRYNLQRKLLSERTNIVARTTELQNIKSTLKGDIDLMNSLQKSSFKEENLLSGKKNIYNVIDLQTIQSLQKNKFEKNSKLISLKTSILDKVITLIYESGRPVTLQELSKYVR